MENIARSKGENNIHKTPSIQITSVGTEINKNFIQE
jgi:hypothetical protein